MAQTTYPPLESETRPLIGTDAAAFYLNRKQQTLRWWATYERGPVLPIRINGRLAWPVARIKEIVGV
ncbi:DNA-binding protein [Hydrogenophaga sp. NFH-34]|uniref:DNA-binding protein n=1 Tax=Hydrogenophaga sp. NFH-34 TaxID=2744446 RepID=UPI001F1C20A2|nr:DNA-binding protein [Hydrogenophaga sp. NFH-34]